MSVCFSSGSRAMCLLARDHRNRGAHCVRCKRRTKSTAQPKIALPSQMCKVSFGPQSYGEHHASGHWSEGKRLECSPCMEQWADIRRRVPKAELSDDNYLSPPATI